MFSLFPCVTGQRLTAIRATTNDYFDDKFVECEKILKSAREKRPQPDKISLNVWFCLTNTLKDIQLTLIENRKKQNPIREG